MTVNCCNTSIKSIQKIIIFYAALKSLYTTATAVPMNGKESMHCTVYILYYLTHIFRKTSTIMILKTDEKDL